MDVKGPAQTGRPIERCRFVLEFSDEVLGLGLGLCIAAKTSLTRPLLEYKRCMRVYTKLCFLSYHPDPQPRILPTVLAGSGGLNNNGKKIDSTICIYIYIHVLFRVQGSGSGDFVGRFIFKITRVTICSAGVLDRLTTPP